MRWDKVGPLLLLVDSVAICTLSKIAIYRFFDFVNSGVLASIVFPLTKGGAICPVRAAYLISFVINFGI